MKLRRIAFSYQHALVWFLIGAATSWLVAAGRPDGEVCPLDLDDPLLEAELGLGPGYGPGSGTDGSIADLTGHWGPRCPAGFEAWMTPPDTAVAITDDGRIVVVDLTPLDRPDRFRVPPG